MINTAKLSCEICTSDVSAPLGLEIWLDNQQIYNNDHVNTAIDFNYDIVDNDAEHELCFIMKNKTGDHTQIGSQGQIISDAVLLINSVAFDDMPLGHTFVEKSEYRHDFNGTQPELIDKFYGSMGCNGTVSLRFTTPIYLWLLEHC